MFIALPQPPYQGPSKVIWLDSAQLNYLTTPSEKSKGKGRADDQSSSRSKRTTAKIVELDEDDEPLDEVEESEEEQGQDQKQDRHHHHHEHGEHCNHDHGDGLLHPSQKKTSDLDPSHYWIIAFNATWSSPCRYFEASHANCSIK